MGSDSRKLTKFLIIYILFQESRTSIPIWKETDVFYKNSSFCFHSCVPVDLVIKRETKVFPRIVSLYKVHKYIRHLLAESGGG